MHSPYACHALRIFTSHLNFTTALAGGTILIIPVLYIKKLKTQVESLAQGYAARQRWSHVVSLQNLGLPALTTLFEVNLCVQKEGQGGVC